MFGHQRVHKDRPYRGAYPPPTFNREGSPPTAEEIEEAARVAAQMLLDMSKGQWASSSSARGVNIDLNIPLLSEEEEEAKEGKMPDLDLNKSPPKDEE
uniref:Uncharacterized protein n=1 Tax=Kalanchoe fedtschenkoi TaxID=63787 RepID=A0A7N0UGG7_KALFE